MLDYEIEQMKVTGYSKWIDLTQYIWNICTLASKLRDDITVIIVMHSETIQNETTGREFTRIKNKR